MATINGTSAANLLTGGAASDTLNGLGGNDTLDGGDGVDALYGGDGDDLLRTRTGDSAFGGSGNDFVTVGGNGVRELSGGSGNDVLRFENGYDITGTSLSGFEQLNAYGAVRMTASQLASFAVVSGYMSTYTSARVDLSQGGAVSVNLSPTLSAYFQLVGSSGNDMVTFNSSYAATIYFYGGNGNDRVSGGAGADDLRGDGGNDVLSGQGGNDTLDGGLGVDFLYGGAGADLLRVRTGATANGEAGDDILSVSASLPTALSGGSGIDTLRFENSYDITGASLTGIERLNAYGAVRMTAAQLDAFDLVSGYASNHTTARVDLSQGGTARVNLSPTLAAYFQLVGSPGDDIITFNPSYARTIYFSGGSGDDRASGGAGDDVLTGGDGRDVLIGLGGADTLDGGEQIDTLYGGAGADLLRVRTGDSAFGGAGTDVVSVNANRPLALDGGSGTDVLRFENSYDITGASLSGIEQLNAYGAARMTAAQLGSFALVSGYASNHTTARVDLSKGGAANVTLGPSLTAYFQLVGSSGNDAISFNATYAGKLYFYGGDGNDRVSGAAGSDDLRGDGGNDVLSGRGGDDILDGGLGADTLDGGAGADLLRVRAATNASGGAGDDILSVSASLPAALRGGSGVDTLRFENGHDITGASLTGIERLHVYGAVRMTSSQLATFDLVSGYASNFTTGRVDLTAGGSADVNLSRTLTGSFELVGSAQNDVITFNGAYAGRIYFYGGAGADRVAAGNGADYLRGDAGNDVLLGRAGNDRMFGGAGIDLLDGGAGADRFVFTLAADSPAGAPDVIARFDGAGKAAGDLIDLTAIDANAGTRANDAFVFGHTGTRGLWLTTSGSDTLVFANTDSDAAAEFSIRIIDGAVHASAYSAADFLL